MVENQAIARVLRLGQTRNVRVVRYIMKGTVEEVIHPSPRSVTNRLTTTIERNAKSAGTEVRICQGRVERGRTKVEQRMQGLSSADSIFVSWVSSISQIENLYCGQWQEQDLTQNYPQITH
jgi:hypothetical protein